jgi:uracil-DNA glycosylase family 4
MANLVPGEGPSPCRILVLAEAPGETEDRLGRPMVGSAGRKLEKCLALAELAREDVHIDNVSQYRPPNNKLTDGMFNEALPGLWERIHRVQPEVVIACGANALRVFSDRKVSMVHGRAMQGTYKGVPLVVVPMYHPAAALHDGSKNPDMIVDWSKLWEEIDAATQVKVATNAELAPLGDYRLATDREAHEYLEGADTFAFDLETTEPFVHGAFVPREARILGYSVCRRAGEALYVAALPAATSPLLEDSRVVKLCHNAKFEYEVLLRNLSIRLRPFEDTKIQAALLGYSSTGLKQLAAEVLGVQMLTIHDVKRGRPTEEILPEEWLPYAAADSDMTFRLFERFREELSGKVT